MFAEIDALRNSALASSGYLGATFAGVDADTRRNLTLTLSSLSDIGSSFLLSKTAISPLFGRTTAVVENGGAARGVSTEGTAGDARAVVAKPTYVFRGDGRPPAQIFDEGFKASGTNTDVLNHATTNANSGLISTSTTPNVAREFADIQIGGYVYTVRKPPQALDVNATLGAKSPYPQEFEIAVPGAIRPQDILGARQVGTDGRFVGPFVKNLGFRR